MRSALFAALVALAACTPDNRILKTQIVWMEWPADVQTFDPFRTRLVVRQPCALIQGFEPSPAADAVSVTFAPYFLIDEHPIDCIAGQGYTSDFTVNVPLDTAGTAPGLPFERAGDAPAPRSGRRRLLPPRETLASIIGVIGEQPHKVHAAGGRDKDRPPGCADAPCDALA